MTEYATTPSALAEWKEQRTRTAEWVEKLVVPGAPLTPSSSSDSEKRSLWDGGGWEPPSDCESSCSVPPTMMLKYPDSRQVVITPTTPAAAHPDGHGHGRGDTARSRSRGASVSMRKRSGSGQRTNRAYVQGEEQLVSPSALGVGERAEHAGSSLHSAEHGSTHTRTRTHARSHNTRAPTNPPTDTPSPAAKSAQNTNRAGSGAVASQTSSMRLTRAAAAPLPDSHSSLSDLSAPRSNGMPREVDVRARSVTASQKSATGTVPIDNAVVPQSSRQATSVHSHVVGSMRQFSVAPNAESRAPSQLPPSHHPSHATSQLPSNAAVPSYPSTHQPSQNPTQQPSQHPSHASSNSPTERPSNRASRQPSHVPSNHTYQTPSNHPSQHLAHTATHQPSHVSSQHPSQRPSQAPSHHSTIPHEPSHPPSAFSNHTVQPSAPPLAGSANGVPISPPSNNSIHSRSISVSDSRSSGPPEPIVVHPPSVHSSVAAAVPGTVASAPSNASAKLSYYSVPPRESRVHESQQNAGQQLLSPLHEERGSVAPSRRSFRSRSRSRSVSEQQNGHVRVEHNGQLPTPVSPAPHTSIPTRAQSTMSTTGLGGGYVLVDVPSPGYEKQMERELADRKGSGSGGKSRHRDRGSLFNVFGVGRGRTGHTRSKSLPMNGMDVVEEKEQPVFPSHTHQNVHNSQMPNPSHNPYPSPISPLSPTSPAADPLSGPHPPPIVYAPARHHRATHYFPPRILYSPGTRQAPYDTQQILYAPGQQGHGFGAHQPPNPYAHAYAHPHLYPQHQYAPNGSPTNYLHPAGIVPAHGYAPAAELGAKASPGSVRRSRTLQEPVRDSGWDEGMKESSPSPLRAAADHHGVKPGDIIPRDFAYEQHASVNGQATPTGNPPPELKGSQASPPLSVKPDGATTPASPTMSQAAAGVGAGSGSDAGSVRTNLAGVGTVSARSRSRGRSAHNDLGHISEGEGEAEAHAEREDIERGRSRSRSRVGGPPGMVYSASAPQPQGGVAPPHAAMMIPPASSVTERGVRDTPYPTPPGSVSEQIYHRQRHYRQSGAYANNVLNTPNVYATLPLHAHPHAHRSSQLVSPVLGTVSPRAEGSPSPSGLVSRFRDIYQSPQGVHGVASPHAPIGEGHPSRSSPGRSHGRGRARERPLQHGPDSNEKRQVNDIANGHGHKVRSKSVDSQASHSSASTYYVLPTPGQKVRIIVSSSFDLLPSFRRD